MEIMTAVFITRTDRLKNSINQVSFHNHSNGESNYVQKNSKEVTEIHREKPHCISGSDGDDQKA